MSSSFSRDAIARFLTARRRFASDTRGNVALLFGLMSVVLFMAVGGSLDFARAYLARQKLSQIATLACQYASRPAIVDTSTSSYGGSNGGSTYVTAVNNFISSTWLTQKVNLTQTNAAPFTYTPGGAANVNLSSSMPALFIQMFGINNVGVSAQSHCYDNVAAITQRVPDSSGQYVLRESFEAGGTAGSYTFYKPNGTVGTQGTATTYSSAIGYTGSTGTQFHVTGYCLEQDSVGVIKSTVADGNFSVELDCDNGSGNKGNSSITTQTYLAAGAYELRYNYVSRVDYPNYDPTYLCGSSAADLSWANDTNSQGGTGASVSRTNQINVYLDLNNSSTNIPPSHTTLDGTQQLDGSNLIDMCVYSANWVERSVSINVTTAGYYWLSFAADGASDSYGGQLDNIRLCRVSCPNSVQDNFPSNWLTSSLLFEDTFENMTVKSTSGTTSRVDISTSYGSSGTAASGWPGAAASGWRISQVNEVNRNSYQPTQGSYSIELDADANVAGVANSNRTITRAFLLDPGYYSVTYYYRSNFAVTSLGTTVYCGATPSAANVNSLTGSGSGSYSGGSNTTKNLDTNIVGLFMSHDLMASDPNYAGYGTVATYTNPDGTSTSSPATPDNSVSLTNYNSAQVNPLLDICGYAKAWQTRTANIFIAKPGNYWMTFAALGTADTSGGSIDDVKLTALGSPYMASPPASPVTIPAPDPQPGTTISYTGFTIKADPFAP